MPAKFVRISYTEHFHVNLQDTLLVIEFDGERTLRVINPVSSNWSAGSSHAWRKGISCFERNGFFIYYNYTSTSSVRFLSNSVMCAGDSGPSQ